MDFYKDYHPLKDILGVGKDHKRVATILFRYLFRGCDKYEYRDLIGDREVAKQVWSRVVNNGYVLRNCKLFAYAVHYNRGLGISTSPAAYEVMSEDVGFLRGLDLSYIDHHQGVKPYSLFDYKNLEAALVGSDIMRVFIGKFVSKKLIFLDKHFGEKRSEIEQTLFEAAIYGLRKQYPYYDSDLHALNICKTSARNKGHGLIEFYTRGKRNKLLNENGSFQAVNVPLESVMSLSVLPAHEDETRIQLQALVGLEAKMRPKLRAFINAAAGQYDAGFTLYIGQDNTDAAHEWEYSRYLTQLRTYHNLSEEGAQRLMLRVRQAMK